MAQAPALDAADLGHLRHLHAVATQPVDAWDGVYAPRSENANFGTRYQLGFAGYALAGLGQRLSAYRAPFIAALDGLIGKLLAHRSWAYWAAHGDPDPLAQGNVMYAGHLACLLGLREKWAGDGRYERPFDLIGDAGVHFRYTYSAMAERIYAQMRDLPYHSVPCEPGNVYVACNNHAALSNRLHDDLYGGDWARVNGDWWRWSRERMVAPRAAPLTPGLLRAVYRHKENFAVPFSLNFLDAWLVAFLAPVERAEAERLYPRLLSRICGRGEQAYLPAGPLQEKLELASSALNSGFAAVAAAELGDRRTAERLLAWADSHLAPTERAGRRWYAAHEPTLFVTALFALARAALPCPGLLAATFSARDAAAWRNAPQLERVEGPAGAELCVDRADWQPATGALTVDLSAEAPGPLTLYCTRLPAVAAVRRDGTAWDDWNHDPRAACLAVRLPGGPATIAVATGA